MNPKNILIDEHRIPWIIDFCSTAHAHILSDFANMEVELKRMMLTSENDIGTFLDFESLLLSQENLAARPELGHSREQMQMTFNVILEVRNHAYRVFREQKADMVEYCVALLYFTFRLVSFEDISKSTKNCALLSAALICERIMQLKPNLKSNND